MTGTLRIWLHIFVIAPLHLFSFFTPIMNCSVKLTALSPSMTFCSSLKAELHFYGRPLSVSGRPCYILPMFFVWPPYSPAMVNRGSRKFNTWWTLSVIREVTTWIFSWSSLNYWVGQKVTKLGIFSDPARKLSALTPERGRIL